MSHLKTFIPEEVLWKIPTAGDRRGWRRWRPVKSKLISAQEAASKIKPEASRPTGLSGRVIGIDMTDTMLERSPAAMPLVAAHLGYPRPNTEFRKGMADAMPVEDASIDLIISNCVINLAPDKRKVFREMYCVLKPGRFTISDIVSGTAVPQYMVHDSAKWGDCLQAPCRCRITSGDGGCRISRRAPDQVHRMAIHRRRIFCPSP
ncbi:MAG: methyltransferase domain-containing protein [Nitrospira sp.]|nr:methyltransferase domain-containing protein [Nitrospira sp.]